MIEIYMLTFEPDKFSEELKNSSFEALIPLVSNSWGFLIRIVGGGIQLGPLGTSATNWPIVPAPGDYEDGEFGGLVVGRENRSIREQTCPSATLSTTNPHDPTRHEPTPLRGKPAANRLSCGTA
jgi:hypothetical protein